MVADVLPDPAHRRGHAEDLQAQADQDGGCLRAIQVIFNNLKWQVEAFFISCYVYSNLNSLAS